MSRLSAALRRIRAAWAAPSTAVPAACASPPPPSPVAGQRVAGRVQCIQLDGYRMYVDLADELVGATIAAGAYEPHVTKAIAEALRSGNTFVDLGANIGYYSLLAAAVVGPGGSVIGFEARPDNVFLARLSVRENGFRNVTLHNLAVADRDSTLRMHAPEHTSLSKVVDSSVTPEAGFVCIPAVALDDALAGTDRVDVLKMDIDGGEVRALQGMRGLLARCRPKLFFEFAPFTLRELGRCDPASLIEPILELGYRLQAIPPTGQPIPLATAAEVVAYQESLGHPQIHVDLVGSCG